MPVVQYKCPNCGGSLELNANSHTFDCAFCLSSFEESQLKDQFKSNEEMPLNEIPAEEQQTQDSSDFAEHTSLYSCPNCGAQIMSEDTTAATFCYYCHSPVILSGRLSGEYRPEKVIPFSMDKESAVEEFRKWCSKKWFLPRGFFSKDQIEKLTGVYLPYWLVDYRADASMHALGKRVRTWRSGNKEYTETQEFDLNRRAIIDFDNLPADGCSKADDKLVEAVEPYNYSELRDFSMAYLSGYLAEKYDVAKEEVYPRIKERADTAAMQYLRESMVGYTSVTPISKDVTMLSVKWHYTLLPMWLMTYKYGGKDYFFAMNGQSRKIAGKIPISIGRLLAFAGGVTAAAGLAAYIITAFIG